MSATRIDYSIRPALATRSGASPCIGFSFAPALATRSGAALRILALATRSGVVPRVDIYSPGVGNTLGGFASYWLFIRPDVGNTLRGYTLRC
jgi:hypothetical protein